MEKIYIFAEIQLSLSNERVLRTGEPYTCEYVTFLQLFNRGTLRIQWYIAQSFYATFSMSVFSGHSFKTAIFNRFPKVAIATEIFMKDVYNDGFLPEFSGSSPEFGIIRRVPKKGGNGKGKLKLLSFVPVYT